MTAFAGQVERLFAAAEEVELLRSAVESWPSEPPGSRSLPETEVAWTPGEILAHVAEMLPYWQGEIERILAGEAPVPFGRVSGTDFIRIATVERDRSLPSRELFGRLRARTERMATRLAELDEADAARVGLHPTLGEMTVAAVVDRMVVTHLEEHAAQLAEALAGAA